MLVSRQCEAEQNHWSINKLETGYHKSPNSSRMSNNFETPLSTQADWQGQYSFLPPGDSGLFSHSYDHVTGSSDNTDSQAQPRSAPTPGNPLDIETVKGEGGSLGNSRGLDPLGLRQTKQSSPANDSTEPQGDQYAHKAAEAVHEESLVSTETPGTSMGSNALSSVSSGGQVADVASTQPNNDAPGGIKDEEEEVLDDDDMVEGEGDGEAPSQPQTAAERTAQRRKMKRFRLTHQQTRFLMSEFAKQPHPDAAHRERLSREIPGLSPRQVQVWFQNRRAKIKRLTADDRDRMIKMRAVPDDFDNVQALHSPYGAVHGLGPPMASPVDYGTSPYGDHMMRPLMVDVRRPEGDEHLSPTGLSPAFGNIGFNPSASLSNSDILSPMSPSSNDRYGYSSHLSTPLSAGPRTSNPFGRQNSMDNSMQMQNHHSRQQIRPLQPLQLREAMTRSRSDNLQSPLRSSMSWKGDAIDYTTYHGGSGSPPLGGRPSVYPHDQITGSSSSGLGGYESSSYSGSTVQSPTHMNYSNFQSSSLQQNPQSRSRLRAASASLPLGLDLRNQFRSVGSGHSMASSGHSSGPRTTSSSAMGAGGAGAASYSASFPSAPLTAPMDFALPRTPGGYRSSATDYSMPQMSAPINPPSDFNQAFQASMGSGSSTAGTTATSRREGDRSAGADDYSSSHSADALGMKRKHSFTGSAAVTAGGQSAYGSTT